MKGNNISENKLYKSGVMPWDFDKVINPEKYQWFYIYEPLIITPSPARDILNYGQIVQYNKVLSSYHVEKGSCHQTASIFSRNISDCYMCDGFYSCGNKWHAHSFCKIGNKYFDPTIENAWGPDYLEKISYLSLRVYLPYEIYLFNIALAIKNNVWPYYSSYKSTIDNSNKGTVNYDYVIDDSGRFLLKPASYRYSVDSLFVSNCA